MRFSSALLLAALVAGAVAVPKEVYVQLTMVPQRFQVVEGPNPGEALAWGVFDDQIHETGFGYLEVYTNESYPDHYQAYAAGLLEGHSTRTLISMHYNNTMRDYCQGQEGFCIKLNAFLEEHLAYLNAQIKQFREKDAYWHQTDLALTQLQGMQEAWTGKEDEKYSAPAGDLLKVIPLLFLNIDGDLEDLEQALVSPKMRRVLGGGHCSALVKVLPDLSDMFVSQVTWSGYSTMLRILKKYTLNYQKLPYGEVLIPGATVTFSSGPGKIFSGDDFHLISTGLLSMETTIGNGNSSLWYHITPKSNLEWMRTIVANRLATTGPEWSAIFQRYASGTYNNEWMIVDYKKFVPGKAIQPGTLTVLEEIPGMIKSGDQSRVLQKQSYWPSYNTAFYKEIFEASGSAEKQKKFGDWFSYDHNPRANIFRRDHVKVKDMDSMLKLMRYNDFQHDEFSKCNCTPPYSAENAISARCDLNPANGTYPFGALGHRSHGATDAKITNFGLFKDLEFLAVSGPTHDPLPPFRWSTSGLKDLHEGHPDLWVFAPHVHHWTKDGRLPA